MNAPCKNCPNRTITCHTVCNTYQAFAEHREKENHKRHMEATNRSRDYSQLKGYWKLLKTGSVNK